MEGGEPSMLEEWIPFEGNGFEKGSSGHETLIWDEMGAFGYLFMILCFDRFGMVSVG